MTWNEFKDEIDSLLPNGDFRVTFIKVVNPSPVDPVSQESIVVDFDKQTMELQITQ